ncbi:MAG: hypothetical protein ACXAD7_18265 [Candidatus Kariarchaeaceae archaeon]
MSCKKALEQFLEKQFEEAKLSLVQCFTKIRRDIIRHRGSKEKLDATYKMVSAKNLEGQIHVELGSLDEATASYDQSKQLLVGINKKRASFLRGQIDYLSSKIAQKRDEEEEFKELLKKSKEHFLNSESYSNAITALFSLSESDYIDEELTLQLYDEILQVNKREKDKDKQRYNQAKVNQGLGSIYYAKDLKKAHSNFKKAYDDYSKLKMSGERSQVLLQLATLEEKYDLKEARKEYTKALELVNRERHKEEYGILICRLAINALKSGDFESASPKFEEGQKYLEEVGNSIARAEYYLEFAKVMLLEARNKEDLSKARSYASDALTNYDTVDDKYGKTLVNIIQGIINLDEGLTQEGTNKLKLTRIYAKNLRKAEYRSSIHSNLVQLVEVDFHDLDGEAIYQQLKKSIPTENLYLSEILHLFAILKTDTDRKFLLSKAKEIINKFVKKQDELKPMVESITRRILNEQVP